MEFFKKIWSLISSLLCGNTIIAKNYTDKSTNIHGSNNVVNNGQEISVDEKSETMNIQNY